MDKIEFYTKFPPTINSYYTKTRNGVFIGKVGNAYTADTIENIIACVGPMTIDTQVSMTVVLYPPDKRKRDVDNYMKPLLDSITKSGLWTDDSLVDQLLIYRGSIVKGGKVWVRLEESLGLILDSDIYRESIN